VQQPVSFFDKQAAAWGTSGYDAAPAAPQAAAPAAPAAPAPQSDYPQQQFGHLTSANFDYTLTPHPYQAPSRSEPIPADAAAVLSAQLRVAAAEMAGAAVGGWVRLACS
jgi:hypothetical protein